MTRPALSEDWPAVAQAYAERIFASLPSVEQLAAAAVDRARATAGGVVRRPAGSPGRPLQPSNVLSAEDVARLARRRALRAISGVPAGVAVDGVDAGVLRALVAAGFVEVAGRVVRATAAGRQAALAA